MYIAKKKAMKRNYRYKDAYEGGWLFRNLAGSVNVAQETVINDFSFVKGINPTQPIKMDYITANGGAYTHLPNESSLLLSVTNTVGSRVVAQSKYYSAYQPTRPLKATFTGVIGVSNKHRCRYGFFDNATDKTFGTLDGNGYFFEYSNGTAKVVHWNYATGGLVESVIEQTNWNVDKMDGNGISGKSVDWTKAQIFVVEMLWYGYGNVKMSLIIDGSVYDVHIFENANKTDKPHLSRAVLPIRMELETIASGGTSQTAKMTCFAVSSIGGYTPRGEYHIHEFAGGNNIVNVTTTETAFMAIRPKSGAEHSTLNPVKVLAHCLSNSNLIIRLYFSVQDVTGGAWASNPQNPHSIIETNKTLTGFNLGSIGYCAEPIYVLSTTRQSGSLNFGTNLNGTKINGTPDIIVLTAQTYQGTGQLGGHIGIQEIT